MQTTDERFYLMVPSIVRAIRRALAHLQPADIEDATQIGLLEFPPNLQEPGDQANTDSWFIWRAVAYARDYARRIVYRYVQRTEILDNVIAYGQTECVEDGIDFGQILHRLPDDQHRQIALLLVQGERKSAIAERLGLSYAQVRRRCDRIVTALAV